jgi:hypothetical protein
MHGETVKKVVCLAGLFFNASQCSWLKIHVMRKLHCVDRLRVTDVSKHRVALEFKQFFR